MDDFTMRPQPDDTSIRLPMTFDYSGGRADTKKTKILLTIVVTVLFLILGIAVLMREELKWYIQVPLEVFIAYFYLYFVRVFIFKENMYSDAYETLKEQNCVLPYTSFWNIYDIDKEYPYICHFQDGKKGIFVMMEKDVVVGKSDNIMYDHFEGVSEALNLCACLDITCTHVDLMNNVGNDPRMQYLYDDLEDSDNEDLSNSLLQIYSNLQDIMSNTYASYDIYLFTTRTRYGSLGRSVVDIATAMLGANYISYRMLNSDGIRNITLSLMNFEEFSAIDACETVLKNNKSANGIILISVKHADGTVEKFNMTQREKQESMDAKEKLRLEKEEAKRFKKQQRHLERQKRRQGHKNDNDDIDLVFNDDTFEEQDQNSPAQEEQTQPISQEADTSGDKDLDIF